MKQYASDNRQGWRAMFLLLLFFSSAKPMQSIDIV